MQTAWLKLPDEKRKQTLVAASYESGIPEVAIEKDYWVVLTLGAIFTLRDAQNAFAFKGGTSLSKGWNLIQRFSEDIDLAINRDFLGFPGELSKNKINKALRPVSENYVTGTLTQELRRQLQGAACEIVKGSDPSQIIINYRSLFPDAGNDYLLPRVKVEAEARFIGEPAESKTISAFVDHDFAFSVPTVKPERTFLEKIFLLHEEFTKPGKIITERMSRHFYDLYQIFSKSQDARLALRNRDFYRESVALRVLFRPTGLTEADYAPENIKILPPGELVTKLKTDYQEMTKVMFYGDIPPKFETLLGKAAQLQAAINQLHHCIEV
jgi:hypothetical protein